MHFLLPVSYTHLDVYKRQALSKTIHLLEEEFKVPLFDRSGKRVQLNENGKILLKYTNRIFQDLENAHMEIDKLNQQEKNTIVLSTLAASYLLPDILIKFREKYPDIIFSLRQSTSAAKESDYDLQIFSSGDFLYDSNICLLYTSFRSDSRIIQSGRN